MNRLSSNPGGTFPPGAPIVLAPADQVRLDARIAAERMRPVDQFELPVLANPGARVVIMTATGEILPWEHADMAEWWRGAAYRLVGGDIWWTACSSCAQLADCSQKNGLCADCEDACDWDGEV